MLSSTDIRSRDSVKGYPILEGHLTLSVGELVEITVIIGFAQIILESEYYQ